jgi:hypothetical protein
MAGSVDQTAEEQLLSRETHFAMKPLLIPIGIV